MLKNKNKVFSLFYFMFGLIVFTPGISYAEGNVTARHDLQPGRITTDNPKLILTEDLITIGRAESLVPPIYSDIPPPLQIHQRRKVRAAQSGDTNYGEKPEQ